VPCFALVIRRSARKKRIGIAKLTIPIITKRELVIYFARLPTKFNSNVLFLDDFSDGEMQGGVELIEEQKVFLIIPYAPEADDLQIFKQDEKIFETKIYDAGAISCKIK